MTQELWDIVQYTSSWHHSTSDPLTFKPSCLIQGNCLLSLPEDKTEKYIVYIVDSLPFSNNIP